MASDSSPTYYNCLERRLQQERCPHYATLPTSHTVHRRESQPPDQHVRAPAEDTCSAHQVVASSTPSLDSSSKPHQLHLDSDPSQAQSPESANNPKPQTRTPHVHPWDQIPSQTPRKCPCCQQDPDDPYTWNVAEITAHEAGFGIQRSVDHRSAWRLDETRICCRR